MTEKKVLNFLGHKSLEFSIVLFSDVWYSAFHCNLVSFNLFISDLNSSTHVIFWSMPEKKLKGYMLDDFKKGLIKFRLYISSNSNMSDYERVYNTSATSYRLPMAELEEGRLYFLAVSMLEKVKARIYDTASLPLF